MILNACVELRIGDRWEHYSYGITEVTMTDFLKWGVKCLGWPDDASWITTLHYANWYRVNSQASVMTFQQMREIETVHKRLIFGYFFGKLFSANDLSNWEDISDIRCVFWFSEE